MTTPATLLLLSVALVLAAVLLFWPPRGLWWRWRYGLLASERVLLEDALKHLHACEYAEHPATLDSVAGALGVGRDRAAELLIRLQTEGLATAADGRWTLSAQGRAYALRVVRTHRLWERYFADRTGMPAAEWHGAAEIREHTTSADEADALAASMGHPRFDPHGDPIPTAAGGLPATPAGRPLPQLPPDTVAEIVHVEDEPAAVYSRLLAEGLHPGMRVRVLQVTPESVRFEADAEEHVLAPVVAANLTVRPRPLAEMPGGWERLSALTAVGDAGRVVGISPALRGVERRRMLDLGLVPGTEVRVVRPAPGGDPVAYRIRGAVVALRRQQAEQIRVERLQDAGEAA